MLTSLDNGSALGPHLHKDLERFSLHIQQSAPLLYPAFSSQRLLFGQAWEDDFDDLLRNFVAKDRMQLKQAVEGYVSFILDGMRLQKSFEQTRRYAKKSYTEAAQEVYFNRDYMLSRYLPGLMLSHYLWPHHYRQRIFFERVFVSHFRQSVIAEFCDIGIGTGFYSRLLLSSCSRAKGWAFDISSSAMDYARGHLEAYGVADRWRCEIRDVVGCPPVGQWPFLVNVEVLEHLQDPVQFLESLRTMLAPGGYGFITAAINAAERDHIYLYESPEEVQEHLEQAGFLVLEQQVDKAYEARDRLPAPGNVAFLVTNA